MIALAAATLTVAVLGTTLRWLRRRRFDVTVAHRSVIVAWASTALYVPALLAAAAAGNALVLGAWLGLVTVAWGTAAVLGWREKREARERDRLLGAPERPMLWPAGVVGVLALGASTAGALGVLLVLALRLSLDVGDVVSWGIVALVAGPAWGLVQSMRLAYTRTDTAWRIPPPGSRGARRLGWVLGVAGATLLAAIGVQGAVVLAVTTDEMLPVASLARVGLAAMGAWILVALGWAAQRRLRAATADAVE